MSEPSCQFRLARYLKARPFEKVAKGTLEDLARITMKTRGETVGRRLRILHEATSGKEGAERKSLEHIEAFKLAEGGRFCVENRELNHAWYWYEPPALRQVREWVMVDGRMKEVIKTVSTSV